MIQITTANLSDVCVINRLAHKIWWHTYGDFISTQQITFMLNEMYSEASLQNQLQQGHTFKLISFENNFCGFASYCKTSKIGLFKIAKLYIHQNYQGLGLGKALIYTIENEVKALGATAIQLNVNRENKAQYFYLKMGYKIFDSVNICYHNFILNDYVMHKQLNN
jgi:diamine N-acetyltransferase